MPVRQFIQKRSSEHDLLVKDLVDEWGNSQSTNVEPIILIDSGRDGAPEHLYVVWSRWEDIDRVARSEIIMDAAEQRLPSDQLLSITIAMGLTPQEAERLGLQY